MNDITLTDLQEDLLQRLLSTSGTFTELIDGIADAAVIGADSIKLEDTNGGNSRESISSLLNEHQDDALATFNLLQEHVAGEVNPFDYGDMGMVADQLVKDALFPLALNTEPFNYNISIGAFARRNGLDTTDIAPEISKITNGFFLQYFDEKSKEYVAQSFIAEDGCSFECQSEGINIDDYDVDTTEYLPFTMDNDSSSMDITAGMPMKVSSGFVSQTLDLLTGKYLNQEAVVGDQVSYEYNDGGDIKDSSLMSDMESTYMSFNMVNDIENIVISLENSDVNMGV